MIATVIAVVVTAVAIAIFALLAHVDLGQNDTGKRQPEIDEFAQGIARRGLGVSFQRTMKSVVSTSFASVSVSETGRTGAESTTTRSYCRLSCSISSRICCELSSSAGLEVPAAIGMQSTPDAS